MTKKFSFIVVLLLSTTIYIFESQIKYYFLSTSIYIKSTYHNYIDNISLYIDTHYSQAQNISELQTENRLLKKIAVQNIFLQYNINQILKNKNLTIENYDTHNIKFLSLVNFKNQNRFWVDFKKFNPKTTYGLIQENHAVGIIRIYNKKPMAILNIDKQCNYSVSIGKNKIMGITKGYNNDGLLIVDFVASKIKINDIVTTSGLDNIFMPNLKVGKVVSIEEEIGYKRVLVQLNFKINTSKLLYTFSPNGSVINSVSAPKFQ